MTTLGWVLIAVSTTLGLFILLRTTAKVVGWSIALRDLVWALVFTVLLSGALIVGSMLVTGYIG